jgi:hypothetical protein
MIMLGPEINISNCLLKLYGVIIKIYSRRKDSMLDKANNMKKAQFCTD